MTEPPKLDRIDRLIEAMGQLESEPPEPSGLQLLAGPCPLRECPHSSGMHDWLEPGVEPMCCVEGCDCGKPPIRGHHPDVVIYDEVPTEAWPAEPRRGWLGRLLDRMFG